MTKKSERGRASARTERPASSRTKPRKAKFPAMTDEQRARALVAASIPLLEMFAVCDDVFTEDDALSAEKRKITLGRIYEQWKRSRAALDDDFDPEERPRRRIGTPSVFHPNDEQVRGFTG